MKLWPWKKKQTKPFPVQASNGIDDQVKERERFGCKICGRLAYGRDAATIILGDTIMLACRRCLQFWQFREQINDQYALYDERITMIKEHWKQASLALEKHDHPH